MVDMWISVAEETGRECHPISIPLDDVLFFLCEQEDRLDFLKRKEILYGGIYCLQRDGTIKLELAAPDS